MVHFSIIIWYINQLLVANGNGGTDNNILFRSTMMKHLNGMFTGGGISFNNDSTFKRIYYTNGTILMLYASIIGKPFGNKVLLQVKDTSNFINPGNDKEWESKHEYSYEIIVPASLSEKEIRKLMLQDINRYLGLNAKIEKTAVSCLALVRVNNYSKQLKTKGGKSEIKINPDNRIKSFVNEPIESLVDAMNFQPNDRPLHTIIVNKTNITSNIDLDLNVTNIQDIPAMRLALKPYGLELIPVKQEMEVFVLTQLK